MFCICSKMKRLTQKEILINFFWMIVSAIVFGLCSFNIFHLLHANLSFIADHGKMAITEGGLVQLVTLLLYGVVSLVAYLVFKCAEKAIVENVTEK